MSERRIVTPAHCAHIAAYYDRKWQDHKCIAWQALRHGYYQWALGVIEWPVNNLYETD